MNTAIEAHPASIEAYVRHGWQLVPIPPGSKGPTHQGWNRKENMFRLDMTLPPGYGIGLAHAYSGTMALDVDEWDTASARLAEHGIDLNGLFNAPDAVVVSSGRQGHGKLLYAMPAPLPSKKLTGVGQDGKPFNYLDFRCATANGLTVQDVLPPSIHPITQNPYRWAGTGHWTRLPMIPESLLKLWNSLLARDIQRTVSTGDTFNTSWQELRAALGFIDPSCSREDWVTCGMALHWAGTETGELDAGLALWDEWSKGSATKYPGLNDLLTQWRSFRTDKHSCVKVGSLIHLATEGGWKRPLPDASAFFSSVESPIAPATIDANLTLPPPEMDMTLWPPEIATRALEVSDHVGCDPLVPLWAGLGAICAVVDARMRLEVFPGFQVPPTLWLMTIGSPADKKTPGSRPMMTPLKEIEAAGVADFKKRLLAWEALEAAHASSKKAYLQAASSPEFLLDGHLPQVTDLPPQPVPLRLTVSDITSQKLVRHSADRPQGFLCYLDEMNAWIRKLTDKTSGEDRSAWVKAYEGDAYEMDRVGAGSIRAENYAISIYGNIQPAVFRDNLKSTGVDGLIQRFLPAILRPRFTRRGEPVPEIFTHAGKWNQLLRLLYALPPVTYRLAPESYDRFRDYQLYYESAKHDERIANVSNIYLEAFGKIEGQIARLALILHLIENPFSPTVNLKSVDRAIAIMQSYVIPALNYALNEVGGLSDGSLDQWVKEHVIQVAPESGTITLSELRRSARRQVDGMSAWQAEHKLTESMEALESAQWVARIPGTGKTITWIINPMLATAYQDYRNAVMRAKQRRLDVQYALGYERAGIARKHVRGYSETDGR